MKISFIIPAYNAAPFLEHCLTSLAPLLQAGHEVLIIDDSSNDNTASIAQAFVNTHPQALLIIQPENLGQSAARNKGLQAATGDYVWFIDADDYINATTATPILQAAETGIYDSISFGICYETGKASRQKPSIRQNHYPDGLSYFRQSIQEGSFRTFPVNKIFRRSFLERHHILFIEGHIYEDMLFNLLFYIQCGPVLNLPIYPYHYILFNPNSTTHKNRIRTKDLDALWFVDYTIALLNKGGFSIQPTDRAFQILVFSFISSCLLKKYLPLTAAHPEAKSIVKAVMSHPPFKQSIQYCATHWVGASRTLMALSLYLMPRLSTGLLGIVLHAANK